MIFSPLQVPPQQSSYLAAKANHGEQGCYYHQDENDNSTGHDVVCVLYRVGSLQNCTVLVLVRSCNTDNTT